MRSSPLKTEPTAAVTVKEKGPGHLVDCRVFHAVVLSLVLEHVFSAMREAQMGFSRGLHASPV